MSTRMTRGSRAKQTVSSNSDKENHSKAPHAPSASKAQSQPQLTSKERSTIQKSNGQPRSSKAKIAKAQQNGKAQPLLTKGTKRPNEESAKTEDDDDYEELPHNMGRVPKAKKLKLDEAEEQSPTTESNHVRTSAGQSAIKTEEDIEQKDTKDPSPKKQNSMTPAKKSRAKQAKPDTPVANVDEPVESAKPTPKRKGKTPKTNEYGLTPGVSPFPDYARPTPEECYEVAEILRKHHPDCHPRPKNIPPPSEIVAGCGEVPSILDALVRTLLSAATTGRNSSSAYQGMVSRYGNRKTGVGKGSVDYNAVRLAPQKDLEDAIASGGLAHAKSKNIKALLDMVYAENQERRKAHLAAKATNDVSKGPKGVETETREQADAEIALADEDVLSLDHYYTLPTYDAIFTFVKYPGIGVKTAACVALFCMQRDCFAVDTHVFRLCKWLGWLPPDDKKVGRDTTFSHLEVRIPDELKYDLHQLFIKHGKTCPRCRASTGESSAKWEDGCVIDHLVSRSGPRKEGGSPVKKSPTKKASANTPNKSSKKSKKKGKSDDEDDDDEEEEDIEMPDLADDRPEDAMPDPDDDEEYEVPLEAVETPDKKKTSRTAPAKKPPAKKSSVAKSKQASSAKAGAKARAKGGVKVAKTPTNPVKRTSGRGAVKKSA